jgi:hypothetical protein
MLIVRQEQMEALAQAVLRRFESDMVIHLADFSPPLFKAVGEDQMRAAVRLGMAKAAVYGFDLHGPVRLFLELMLLFGSHFDTDPQYVWLAEILTNQKAGSQMERGELLYHRAMLYRKNVIGPNDEYMLRALHDINTEAQKFRSLSGEDHTSYMLGKIKQIYPEKFDYIGSDALERLIRGGYDRAIRHGFSTGRSMVLIVILMLAFGHGCDDDPLYPWIARTLADPAITNADARAKRLETKALTWLKHVLDYFNHGEKA